MYHFYEYNNEQVWCIREIIRHDFLLKTLLNTSIKNIKYLEIQIKHNTLKFGVQFYHKKRISI